MSDKFSIPIKFKIEMIWEVISIGFFVVNFGSSISTVVKMFEYVFIPRSQQIQEFTIILMCLASVVSCIFVMRSYKSMNGKIKKADMTLRKFKQEELCLINDICCGGLIKVVFWSFLIFDAQKYLNNIKDNDGLLPVRFGSQNDYNFEKQVSTVQFFLNLILMFFTFRWAKICRKELEKIKMESLIDGNNDEQNLSLVKKELEMQNRG